mgnify:CR=1 FL=1
MQVKKYLKNCFFYIYYNLVKLLFCLSSVKFIVFGLKKAWITQGTEVLTWLSEALSIKEKS